MFTALSYIYLLRFPLLCGMVLGAFGLAANGPAKALLSGMFDLDRRGVFLVAYCAAWVTGACFFSTQLILRYAHLRFHVAPPSAWWSRRAYGPSVIEAAFLGAYSLAAGAFFVHLGQHAAAGSWAAIAFALLAFAFTIWVVSKLRANKRLMKWNARIASWLAFTPDGYIGDPPGQLLDFHGRALAISAAGHVLYGALGISKGIALGLPAFFAADRAPAIPTLAGVLLLIMLVCWNGAALAFFFDRFRVPVVAVILVLLVTASQWPQSDHYFDVSPRINAPLLPHEVLAAPRPDAGSAIVVAVSGGGIQAAAWSARVLTGLHEESHGRFAPAVRLISSVSGGSVGTMQFLAAYTNGELTTGPLNNIFDRATTSSLDQVAWGVIYPDLLRLVAPFLQPRRIGRGWALERAWDGGREELLQPLSNWRPLVKSGGMPAVMFNATIVETGARAVFATVDADRQQRSRSARSFYEIYPDHDVTPVTAARLSATFPYVSPAARPDAALPRSKRFHFVDGGYWDNFGVASAIEFIDQAVSAGTSVKKILLIEVHDRKLGDVEKSPGSRGGLFQTIAPLVALYRVRDNGQVTRNAEEIKLLAGYLETRGVSLTHAVFESPQENAPLSWHLTAAEIQNVRDAWTAMADRNAKHDGFCKTLDFLSGIAGGSSAATTEIVQCPS